MTRSIFFVENVDPVGGHVLAGQASSLIALSADSVMGVQRRQGYHPLTLRYALQSAARPLSGAGRGIAFGILMPSDLQAAIDDPVTLETTCRQDYAAHQTGRGSVMRQ